MPKRPQIEITKEDLERASAPINHVLLKMLHTSEGIKSKGGVIIGFNTENTYAEGDSSWVADLAEVYAEVYKLPDKLFFDPDDPRSMDWETEIELCEGDICYFSALESKNSTQLICDNVLYKSIPYADIFAYKREVWVDKWKGTKTTVRKPINGFILCSLIYNKKISPLDAISETQIDKSRGVVAFVSEPVKSYIRPEYCHISDLRVGDEVLFDPKVRPFLLERTTALATFNGNELYWCLPRRRISMIL
jgi:hypothetical protein